MLRTAFLTLLFYVSLPAQAALDPGVWDELLEGAVADGRVDYRQWRDKYKVAGRKVNLYDLEHELIRPLGEARIHYVQGLRNLSVQRSVLPVTVLRPTS